MRIRSARAGPDEPARAVATRQVAGAAPLLTGGADRQAPSWWRTAREASDAGSFRTRSGAWRRPDRAGRRARAAAAAGGGRFGWLRRYRTPVLWLATVGLFAVTIQLLLDQTSLWEPFIPVVAALMALPVGLAAEPPLGVAAAGRGGRGGAAARAAGGMGRPAVAGDPGLRRPVRDLHRGGAAGPAPAGRALAGHQRRDPLGLSRCRASGGRPRRGQHRDRARPSDRPGYLFGTRRRLARAGRGQTAGAAAGGPQLAAGGARADRAGAPRRGRPPHVGDRRPRRDRAVPYPRAASGRQGRHGRDQRHRP